MTNSVERIVWIDTETSGLDSRFNALLEVACLVTDTDLNILDETGYQSAIRYSIDEIRIIQEQTDRFVLDMHTTSGLWDRLPQGKPVEQVEAELLAYIRSIAPVPRQARLGGNSVALDKDFLRANMPQVLNHLHYRVIDVSTLFAVSNWWGDVPAFEKTLAHEAMSDIRESIAELAFLRDHLTWLKSGQ